MRCSSSAVLVRHHGVYMHGNCEGRSEEAAYSLQRLRVLSFAHLHRKFSLAQGSCASRSTQHRLRKRGMCNPVCGLARPANTCRLELRRYTINSLCHLYYHLHTPNIHIHIANTAAVYHRQIHRSGYSGYGTFRLQTVHFRSQRRPFLLACSRR